MGRELNEVRQQLSQLRTQHAVITEVIRDELAVSQGVIEALNLERDVRSRSALDTARDTTSEGRPEQYEAWGGLGWEGWAPESHVPGEVRIGDVSIGSQNVPATVPVFGGQSVVLVTDGEAAARNARAVMRALAARLSLSLGQRGTIHLIDPAGEGYGFPERDHLTNVAPLNRDATHALLAVIDAAYARRDAPDGRVDAVLALDFPTRYGYGAVEALNRTARLASAGVQLIVHHDLTRDQPGATDDLDLVDPVVVVIHPDGVAAHAWGSLLARLDPAPPLSELSGLTARMTQPAATAELGADIVDWDTLYSTNPDDWWQESVDDEVRVAVALDTDGALIELVFGQDSDGTSHTHAVVGGQSGSGKSELLHSFIAGAVTRYAPEDLQLYLIDGQAGVEFQRYAELAHADLVSLNTPVDLARGTLTDVSAELSRRDALLTSTGLTGIAAFRRAGGGRGDMPRLIVIIDEYQRLFDGDNRDDTARILQRITAQGRKVGIHLLLASQSFHAVGLLNQNALFNNITTRIGLRLPPDSVDGVDEFAREGRALLRNHCSAPGSVVINPQGGADGHNRAGRVAWLRQDVAADILDRVAAKAAGRYPHRRPEVINGKVSPLTGDNRALRGLSSIRTTDPTAVQEWAERPARDGGLALNSWQPYDQPWAFVAGRTFTAHGSAVAKVDRAAEHNVALVVADAAALNGMLLTGLASAAMTVPAGALHVRTLTELPGVGVAWQGALSTQLSTLLARRRHTVEFACRGGDAEELIDAAVDELERRTSLPVDELAALGPSLVMATGLERLPGFRMVAGTYGDDPSPATNKLLRLVHEGPFVGIHVVLGFTSAAQWSQVMPPKAARHFVHRFVTQMSEDDSRVIVDSSFGSRVMPAGTDGPQRCGYHQRDTQQATVFLPYAATGTPGQELPLAADLSIFLDDRS